MTSFRVELVWKDADERAASSIYLTADGRVILQGRAISNAERRTLALPEAGDMISVNRELHPRHQGNAVGQEGEGHVPAQLLVCPRYMR